ncbi:MAG TPA: hypothetical protein DCS09_08535 [Porphyromonadaceae bacterium]|nr:hypothetical protein [Porphyromonadaceae bacterium]
MDLHGKIMNIQCEQKYMGENLHDALLSGLMQEAYNLGHRDARHAAAELALADYAALQQSHAELLDIAHRCFSLLSFNAWSAEEYERDIETISKAESLTTILHDNTHDVSEQK